MGHRPSPANPCYGTHQLLDLVRTLYDSVTAADIPLSAELVAGYINGRYAWSAQDWMRWPAAREVQISTDAWKQVGLVLDVENGDARPEQANGWIIGATASSGYVPTIYGKAQSLQEVRRLVSEGGLTCDYWLADWTGSFHLPEGYALCQYAAPGHGSPGHYDLSAVADWWPKVA